jgi:hypothetical protein
MVAVGEPAAEIYQYTHTPLVLPVGAAHTPLRRGGSGATIPMGVAHPCPLRGKGPRSPKGKGGRYN